jgi:hypothetical protein
MLIGLKLVIAKLLKHKIAKLLKHKSLINKASRRKYQKWVKVSKMSESIKNEWFLFNIMLNNYPL